MKISISHIIKWLTFSLVMVWFVFMNVLSFAGQFYTPPVSELYKEVPVKAEYCHIRANLKSNYPVTRDGRIESPNRSLFGIFPTTHMVFSRENIDDGYIEYDQYFLIVPTGKFQFPCTTTQWP